MNHNLQNKIASRLTKAKKKVEEDKRINQLKQQVKSEEAYIEKCEEYSIDPDFIDKVPIIFEDLDVSAKTVNGEVFLNSKLFDQEGWHDQMRYIVHEIVHVMQQDAGMVEENTNREDYLDDENEQEAFQAQLQYMDEHTPEEIQSYLERLLDHHDIKGKERKEKVRVLTEDI